MSELFLTDAEIATLTGRRLKSKQIEWLKKQGIPFRTNATGHPVITRSTIEGQPERLSLAAIPWTPRVIGAH